MNSTWQGVTVSGFDYESGLKTHVGRTKPTRSNVLGSVNLKGQESKESASMRSPKQPSGAKALSSWGKVGIIAGGGMALFLFSVAIYLVWTGILPAANRLTSVQTAYAASGAPQSIADVEKIYNVPDEKNAALILDYLAAPHGTKTRIEFPLAGKKGGERYSVSWKKFIADVDRAASRPHFRPKRNFSNPYGILLPEFSLFRWSMVEAMRHAESCLDRGDLKEAEKFVERACLLDLWASDQPFLIAGYIRISNVPENLRLVGKLATFPSDRPEVSRMLTALVQTARRAFRIDDAAAIEAFSFSRLGEIANDPEAWGGSLVGGTSTSSTSAFEKVDQELFGLALKSPMGRAAMISSTTQIANDFFREWKRSKNIDGAFSASNAAMASVTPNHLTKIIGTVLPMVTAGFGGALESKPEIYAQMIEIAQWLRKGNLTGLDFSELKATDLPSALRYDVLNNPITVVKSGGELRIYSYGPDGKDDMGSAKDMGFSVQLKP